MSNTIVTTYGESQEIIRYMNDFCGKCRSQLFKEWYQTHEAFFVTEGVLIMDDLMYKMQINDEGNIRYKSVRFCLKFDIQENYSSFSIINYYNQDKIASFRFIPSKNLDFKNIKIVRDFTDLSKFQDLGEFSNPILLRKIKNSLEAEGLKIGLSRPSKLKQFYEKSKIETSKLLLEYMCEHSVVLLYSMMYYYTKQKPEKIKYSSYFGFQEELEYTTKKETYTYKYTGYINLNDTKVYRTKINNSLFYDKKKEYERHIESWTVRGHYRKTKTGEKIWVKDHVRGEGVLENRIYGTKPASEVLLIPKEIECEREVIVSLKKKQSTIQDEIVYMDETPLENYAKALNILFEDHKSKQIPDTDTKQPIIYNPLAESVIERTEPIKRYTRWQRIKILFHKITNIILKNNKK
jgi:hypothetical protein